MTDNKASVTRVLLTCVGRMSHPHLVTPRPYMENGVQKGDPRYSTSLIIEPADLASFRVLNVEAERLDVCDFKKVVPEMFMETWPDVLTSPQKIIDAAELGGLKWPIGSGDKEAQKPANKKFEEAFLGKKVIRAHSNEDYPPTLRCVEGGKRVTLQPEIAADAAKIKRLFKAGNYADMEVNAKTSQVDGRMYLTLYLNSICFIKPGESIGRGGVSLMDMAGVQGGQSDHDPTAGLSDEIDI